MKKFLILSLIIIPFFQACSPYKHIIYLNPLPAGKDTLFDQARPAYRLQPSDILYVRIVSTNREVSDLYNPVMGGGTTSLSSMQGGMYLYGFVISDSGLVNLPILGKVEVAGITIDEAQQKIQQITDKYLNEALAIVKLAQYKFTVLGEVNSPGNKNIQTDRINIFEAIAIAGDVSYSGKRNKVLVIRQELKSENPGSKHSLMNKNKGGSPVTGHESPGTYHLTTHTYQIDLTSPDILTSEAYFIQPNDIIYVKPNFMRAFRITAGDYLLILGSVTSTITAIFLLVRL